MVIDGPFPETKELIAGFWIWKVKSKEEAVQWLKRCPNPMPGPSEIEIRPIFEAEDFGAEFTPKLREQEDRLRAQVETARHVRLFARLLNAGDRRYAESASYTLQRGRELAPGRPRTLFAGVEIDWRR